MRKKKTVDEEWDAWNQAQMKKTQSDNQVLYLATLHVKINGLVLEFLCVDLHNQFNNVINQCYLFLHCGP